MRKADAEGVRSGCLVRCVLPEYNPFENVFVTDRYPRLSLRRVSDRPRPSASRPVPRAANHVPSRGHLGDDGLIYAIPGFAKRVLRINPHKEQSRE